MEFYWKRIRCKVNGQNAGGGCYTILTDTQPADQEIHYSWNNIEEYEQFYANYCAFSFHIWVQQTKKGWKCDPAIDKLFNKIYKQWKNDPLDIEITIAHEPAKLSLNQILDWYDSDRAMQYLLERGMNCIKK